MSDAELLHYFQKERSNTCGRFRPEQLDRFLHEPQKPEKLSIFYKIAASLALLFMVENTEAELPANKKIEFFQKPFQKLEESSILIDSTNKVLRGIVVDSIDKSPIPGVSITVKGTNLSTYTDAKGTFTLSLKEASLKNSTEIIFSFVGYESSTLKPASHHFSIENIIMLRTQITGAFVVCKKKPKWYQFWKKK